MGSFIEVEANLAAREAWLEANRSAVQPYLRDPLECTIFTFDREEPADRGTTRIGGLPYWPPEKPWPVCRSCSIVGPQVMDFVGQIDFRNPEVRCLAPGDLLTFHYCFSCNPWGPDRGPSPGVTDGVRERHNLPTPDIGTAFRFVVGGASVTWQQVGPRDDLLKAEEVPAAPDLPRIGPFYGRPCRTIDYAVPPEAYGGGIAGEEYTYLYFTLQGTKIGGYPPPIQAFETPRDARGRPMRFLATLGSLTGYSVDNTRNWSESRDDLMWGDMGCVYFYISTAPRSSETTWFIECY